jgi:hypothetical protein
LRPIENSAGSKAEGGTGVALAAESFAVTARPRVKILRLSSGIMLARGTPMRLPAFQTHDDSTRNPI